MTNTPPPPPLVCAIIGGDDGNGIDDDTLRRELCSFLKQLGERDDVFLLPPDYTRFHSKAGKITQMIAEYYRCIPINVKTAKQTTTSTKTTTTTATADEKVVADDGSPSSPPSAPLPPSKFQIMPALGTHAPMTKEQIEKMYGSELASLLDEDDDEEGESNNPFLVHDWRNDVVTIGHVPNEMVRAATNGMVDEPWPAQLNKAVWEKRLELHNNNNDNDAPNPPLVVSIGQVVPHEVMGMANFNKNLFVGVGGLQAINLSHFIGAVYGMENMMGRAENPLRAILNYASEKFLQNKFDLWYILTVVAPNGKLQGLFIGNTIDCYKKACELSMKVNFTMLDRSPTKMVVYLDPDEFHSTWLGNKAIYRTRMAIADDGELIVLAPGIRKFGEDDAVDVLIRKYGYVGTPKIMDFLRDNPDELKDNLGAVAHLIHGSTEGRFQVTYCSGHLTKEEITGVGFNYASLETMSRKYDVDTLQDGWQTDNETGEEYFFIKNPALGLWAVPSRFEQ